MLVLLTSFCILGVSSVLAEGETVITSYGDLVNNTGNALISRNSVSGYDITFSDDVPKIIKQIGLPDLVNTRFDEITSCDFKKENYNGTDLVLLNVHLKDDLIAIDLINNQYTVSTYISVVADKVLGGQLATYNAFFKFDKPVDHIQAVTLSYNLDSYFTIGNIELFKLSSVQKTDVILGEPYRVSFLWSSWTVSNINVSADPLYDYRITIIVGEHNRINGVVLLKMKYLFESVEYDSYVIDNPTDPTTDPGNVFPVGEGFFESLFSVLGISPMFDFLSKFWPVVSYILVIIAAIVVLGFVVKFFRFVGGLYRPIKSFKRW
jgi:hypothetical protein